MLDFLYTLFIAPLEYWMHKALLWGFENTHEWGLAIIVMSLIVNIVILPIYMKAEAWQEDERAIRMGFEDKEKMIKRAFKGQERFAMITTMHRQAGYSPLLTLRSSIGFFLQIPFFFAAYHFLSHFQPLAGISFLGLTDLSKPDEMIKIGGFAINFMPILMTVINIASALIYTKNLSQRDKYQLYGMAALFLVLLYNAASGLVLYWTCNNIFSLGKNIVYDLVRRAHPWLQKTATTVKTAVGHFAFNTKDDIAASCSAFSGLYLLLIWAVATAFGILSSNQMTQLGDALKLTLSDCSDYLYLALAALAIIEAIRVRLWRHPLAFLLVAALLYYEINVWCKWYFAGANRHYFALSAAFGFLIISLILVNFKFGLKRLLYPVNQNPATLLTPAAIWLTVLLSFYLPLIAYSTAPEGFSKIEDVLALLLACVAVTGVFFFCLVKLFECTHYEKCAGYTLGVIALIMTVYGFLLPLNVGTINAFIISDPQPLFRPINVATDAAVIALCLLLFFWIIRSGKAQWIRALLVLCIAGSFINSVYTLWNTREAWQRDAENEETVQLPDYNDRLFGFSRDGQNVVVVMLDAFAGRHLDRILEETPALKDQFRGFTWYREALATGPSTLSSLPSIVCGEKCTPWELNKEPDLTLAEKINRGFADTLNRFGPSFDAVLYERNWTERGRLSKYTSHDPLLIRNIGDSYIRRYAAQNNLTIDRGNSDSFLIAVSLFNTVPWGLKNVIYKDGRWIERLMGESTAALVYNTYRDLALFAQLPEISNTKAEKNTFKFIDSELSHYPWFTKPGTCELLNEETPGTRADGIPEGQMAAESCSLQLLGKWFDWMRENKIFDNTTLVVVSDHSSGFVPELKAAYENGEIGRPSSLLLIKPQNANDQAPLKVTDDHVGIVDTMHFIFASLEGKTIRINKDVRNTFVPDGLTANLYRTERFWEVKGSMYDKDSWNDLTEKN